MSKPASHRPSPTEEEQPSIEEALRAEREQLHSIFMQAPALIAILRGPNHVFEMVNPLYAATVAPKRQLVGRPLMEVLYELEGQGILELINHVYETGEPYTGEIRTKVDRHETGVLEEHYYNVSYQPIYDTPGEKPSGIFVHAVNITPQVLSRQRVEQLNAQLEAVFESMPDGFYIAEGNAITHVNQRGAEAFGYRSPDEVPRDLKTLNQQLSIRYAPNGELISLGDGTIGNGLRGKSIERVGVEITNPVTGKVQILRTTGAPIRNKDGKVVGAVAINSDITETYRLQEKVQKAAVRRRLLIQKAKLLKAQNTQLTKLNATKDEFIALTSHQLRTPATGVKQYIAMLMQGYAGPITSEQKQFLERAYESNERQLRVIEDILRVARVDMGKTSLQQQTYDVVRLVRDVLAEQADRFSERGLTLVVDLPTKPLEAHIDPAQLHMAIANVIDNAIKYTPDGKQISVGLQPTTTSQLRLEIADEGVGVAKADLPKLFQKFSRIPNARSILVGGNGLGLYWTQRILELHGGSVTVKSQLGKGTCFTISLPRSRV